MIPDDAHELKLPAWFDHDIFPGVSFFELLDRAVQQFQGGTKIAL